MVLFLRNIMGNYEESNKYLLLAVNQGYPDAMHNYANNLEKQGNIAGKYYFMAFEKGLPDSLLKFITLLKIQNKYDELFDLYSKYRRDLLMDFLNKKLSENLNSEKILNIILELSDQDLKSANYYVKIINKLVKSKIDLIELNFKYQPNGTGYLQSKSDFLNRLANF